MLELKCFATLEMSQTFCIAGISEKEVAKVEPMTWNTRQPT